MRINIIKEADILSMRKSVLNQNLKLSTVYRPEIDGLRAIAVGLVILYHFTLTRFASGGFIGVDIFFVISGYLITSTFKNDLRSGIVGIGAFYRRRILRIFPALFSVFLTCWIIEVCIRFSQDIVNFRRGLISAIFFASNINFWLISNYFDFSSRDNALLHTWSLSVEEQFYIILPLMLISFHRLSQNAQSILLILCGLASLAAAQLCLKADASAAFYLVPFRIWEFLIGSALSLKLVPTITNHFLAEALGIMGIGLVLAASLLLDTGSAFPGVNAIAPVLGTAFVLAGTELGGTIVGRMLSLWPARIIGLSSYSLYLWHWPVLVYSKYLLPSSSISTKMLSISVCISLALLSWRFVEQPFRRRGRGLATSQVLWGGFAAMIVLALLAITTAPLSRYLWPRNPGAEAALQTLHDNNFAHYRQGTCFGSGAVVFQHRAMCLSLSSKRNVLILGDSHAAQLWYGYSVRYPNINFLQATVTSCTPVESFGDRDCEHLMNFILNEFLPKHHLDAIVLSGRWQSSTVNALNIISTRLTQVASKVLVIGPFQEYSLPFAEVVARARYSGKPNIVERYRDPQTIVLDHQIGKIINNNAKVMYISAVSLLCRTRCVVEDHSGKLLMFDNQHLTTAGSVFFAAQAGGLDF